MTDWWLVTIVLAVATGLAVVAAIVARESYQPRRYRLFLIAAASLVCAACFAFWQSLRSPLVPHYMQSGSNNGFGPDWVCEHPPNSEPVCIKKVLPEPVAPNPSAGR